jgi:hypothetical protein
VRNRDRISEGSTEERREKRGTEDDSICRLGWKLKGRMDVPDGEQAGE